MIRVVVAADVRFYREGLADLIARHPSFAVLGTAANRTEALELVRKSSPDIMLLDAAMPDGLMAVADIATYAPGVKVVVTALAETALTVLEWAEAGVAGYVPRDASLVDLLATIDRTARGELQCSAQVAASMFRRLWTLSKVANERHLEGVVAPLSPLTPREQQIMRLIEQGMSNKDIARHLGIGVATAKSHVHHILEKLRVRRRAQVAARLRRG
jgi:two-component system, NarL family, nitrate/nitrite response regulator NarL